jgi:hypothetical protein
MTVKLVRMAVHRTVVAALPVTRRRMVVVELSIVASHAASDSPMAVVVVDPTWETEPALFTNNAEQEYAAACDRSDLTAVTSHVAATADPDAIVKLSSVVTVAFVVSTFTGWTFFSVPFVSFVVDAEAPESDGVPPRTGDVRVLFVSVWESLVPTMVPDGAVTNETAPLANFVRPVLALLSAPSPPLATDTGAVTPDPPFTIVGVRNPKHA